tara:strand:+ start:1545 stop:2378 length:834 start_codon:yes stop_codon:yes gene_type:complete
MTGEIQSYLFPPADIVLRARRLLDGKSDFALQVIDEHISSLLADYDLHAIKVAKKALTPERDPDFFTMNSDAAGNDVYSFDEKQIEYLHAERVIVVGPAFSLQEWLSLNDSPQADLLEGLCTEYQAFAALALVYFSKATMESNPLDHESLLFIKPAKYLIWSMESLCYAELLFSLKSVEKKTRKIIEAELSAQRKQRSAAGNKKRHSKTHKYKALAISEWKKRRSSTDSKINSESVQKASESIAEILPPYAPGKNYTPRTVYGWLRAHAEANNIKLS